MKRKRDVLRDAVIAAAREVVRVHGSYSAVIGLHNAFDDWDAELERVDNTPGAWVEGSPGTSRAAGISFTPHSGSLRRAVINELFMHHRSAPSEFHAAPGLTVDDLERHLHRSHQSVSSAVNWLEHAGWIVQSGFVRTTRAGRDAIVWRLTAPAFERLMEGE